MTAEKKTAELLDKLKGGKSKSKKGLPRRTGHRKLKIKAYYETRYIDHKLRHMLSHNGDAAAKAWATERNIISRYRALKEAANG